MAVAPLYKSTHHRRLKISYCPIQRPLCGKACVSRLGVAYSSVVTMVVSSVLLLFDRFYGASAVKMSLSVSEADNVRMRTALSVCTV